MTACASPVAEAPAPMAEKARCGKAALTVWGVQSPLVAGQRFSACLRAKSLDGLPLGDARAVVFNEDGAVVGAVRLAGEKAGGSGARRMSAGRPRMPNSALTPVRPSLPRALSS